MAIRAIVEGRDIKQDRVIELATGMTDELGNPFELIELTPLKPTRKIDGFQNAYIYITGGDSTPKIKYGPRSQGNIEFVQNELGISIGKVAKTPQNMEMLAATYHDKVWKPLDKNRAKIDIAATKELDRKIEMTKKMDELKKADAPAEQKSETAIGRAAREMELEAMNFAKLRKLAEATGLLEPGFSEKQDLIGAVLRYEHNKQKGPQEELKVE
jgi:hypothetical protein